MVCQTEVKTSFVSTLIKLRFDLIQLGRASILQCKIPKQDKGITELNQHPYLYLYGSQNIPDFRFGNFITNEKGIKLQYYSSN